MPTTASHAERAAQLRAEAEYYERLAKIDDEIEKLQAEKIRLEQAGVGGPVLVHCLSALFD